MDSADVLRQLDARYVAAPPLAQWQASVPTEIYRELHAELQQRRQSVSDETYRKAIEFALRAAALDTGALEDLYRTDRGLTFTVAMQAVAWQSSLDDRGGDIRRLFDAQLEAHELLLDAVSEKAPVSEAWIRRLHEELCRAQDTYRVLTSQGFQDPPFPKGDYKKHPNHVRLENGSFFAYAPVAQTPSEVHRMVEELRSEQFLAAHPILQAAYSHYTFVRIHPFADGNGRVARALASLYLLKAYSVPLVIFADQKEEYLDALRDADGDQFQTLVDFFGQRVQEILEISIEQLKAPPATGAIETLPALAEHYRLHGSAEANLDQAAYRLIFRAQDELRRQLDELQLPPGVDHHVAVLSVPYDELEQFRPPVTREGKALLFSLSSGVVESGSERIVFGVYTSKPEHSGPAEILLYAQDSPWTELGTFKARADQVLPKIKNVLEVRLGIWIRKLVDSALRQLLESSRAASGSPPTAV